jgi:hypothetical protein
MQSFVDLLVDKHQAKQPTGHESLLFKSVAFDRNVRRMCEGFDRPRIAPDHPMRSDITNADA